MTAVGQLRKSSMDHGMSGVGGIADFEFGLLDFRVWLQADIQSHW